MWAEPSHLLGFPSCSTCGPTHMSGPTSRPTPTMIGSSLSRIWCLQPMWWRPSFWTRSKSPSSSTGHQLQYRSSGGQDEAEHRWQLTIRRGAASWKGCRPTRAEGYGRRCHETDTFWLTAVVVLLLLSTPLLRKRQGKPIARTFVSAALDMDQMKYICRINEKRYYPTGHGAGVQAMEGVLGRVR